MASLAVGKDFIILSFPQASIVLNTIDDNCTERLLVHVNSITSTDELDKNDINSQIICSSLSSNKELFTCCVNKNLYLWKTNNWELISNRLLNRTVSAITFSPRDDNIAIADKSGDVLLFSVGNPEKDGELILGHISMLLDVLITPNNKFIITCDRDEKIRVSCYPNAYNIQSFCLGHEEFVTSLNILPHNSNILISGSGDGTLRFWEYENGDQLYCYVCNECGPEFIENNKPVISKIVSLKINENSSILCTQIVSFKGILVYTITSGSNKREINCNFMQLLPLKSEPWNFNFNSEYLWVFIENIEMCITKYLYNIDKKEFILEKEDCLSNVYNCLKKHTSILENVFKKERQISTLYKRRFDNVQEYLKRKMDRIEANSKSPIKKLSVSQVS